jgi:hypothetical protein
MGLLDLLLLPSNVRIIKKWALSNEVVLPYVVKTTSGGKVKKIRCIVDIYYTIKSERIKVVKVRLARSSVSNLRRGELWDADANLRRLLKRLLPKQIDKLVAKDKNLQRIMWGKAANIVPASKKQKVYAKKLGIPLLYRISKGSQALGKLIEEFADEKKNKQKQAR